MEIRLEQIYWGDMKKVKAIKKLGDSIIHLIFESRQELCETMCRLEEHSESPEFAGKVFTLGQYRERYSKRYGAWSYYTDWSGFNIPDYAFKAFIEGKFDPLTEAEQEVVDLFRYKAGPFCVIATFKGSDPDVIPHEVMHGLFYTNQNYKNEVLELLTKYDTTAVQEHIRSLGYGENVVLDETHAYIGASSNYLDRNKIEYPTELRDKLVKLQESYKLSQS